MLSTPAAIAKPEPTFTAPNVDAVAVGKTEAARVPVVICEAFKFGISEESSALKPGAEAPLPEGGPIKTWVADCAVAVRVIVPALVIGPPEAERNEGTAISTLVTVPSPSPETVITPLTMLIPTPAFTAPNSLLLAKGRTEANKVPVLILLALIEGISASTKALKEGVAEEPEDGPTRTKFAAWFAKLTVIVPEVVTGELVIEKILDPVTPTLVTEPSPTSALEIERAPPESIDKPFPTLIAPNVPEAAIGKRDAAKVPVVIFDALRSGISFCTNDLKEGTPVLEAGLERTKLGCWL